MPEDFNVNKYGKLEFLLMTAIAFMHFVDKEVEEFVRGRMDFKIAHKTSID